MASAEIPAFGEALATFRTRVGLSQQKLANMLGMNRRSIAAWEAGNNLPKTKGTVLQLVRILKLNDEEATTLLNAAGIDPSFAIWSIPYPLNPFFTGRDQELEHLHVQLQQGPTAVVGQVQSISGLGGIGKTQLAVEYAYRHQDEYQYVLWGRVESMDALTASFSEIAHLLDLPEKNAEVQAITIEAVKRWLQRRRGWLLILDNAEHPALLPDFLPPTIGGHLLITTRAAEVSAHLSGLAHPLVVDTFSDEQGALFLLHRSGLLVLDATLDQAEARSRQLAREIAHELGGLPLALDQAGAYLRATGCSLATYQHIYQQHRAMLLAQRRGTDHPEPVATTWNISFKSVEQQNPAAADLLRLCSFLVPDAIPEAILTKGGEALGPLLARLSADAYQLNEAIEALRAYSLITRDPHKQTLTVHRLLQAVLKDAMRKEEQDEWIERATKAMQETLPEIEYTTWEQCEQWLPHAQMCVTLSKETARWFVEQAQVAHWTGSYLLARHRLQEAGPYLLQALTWKEEHLDHEHVETAVTFDRLARWLDLQGRYSEAEPLYQRAIAIWEQKLGATHPNVAKCLNNLALLYYAQGRYEEAEPLYQRTLSIWEQKLGPKHLDIATGLNNLALLYYTQGRYSEAEPLYQRAIAIYEQNVSASHPSTAQSLNNLAELYRVQGRYEEAELLLQRAIAIREQQEGTTHPNTAQSLNNLAVLYESQGKYEEAEFLYQRVLSIYEQQVGAIHPATATSLNNLAALYKAEGKYSQAEPLYQRALSIWEQRLGATHPNVAICLNNLAVLYESQGRYSEAEPLYQRALSIWEQRLDATHPSIALGLNNLAELYYVQKKYQEAEPLYQRALLIREQLLGATHPDTATSFNKLTKLYQAQGRYKEAEQLLVRAATICEQQLGIEHPQTQQLMSNYLRLLSEIYTGGDLEALLRLLTQEEQDEDKDEEVTKEESS